MFDGEAFGAQIVEAVRSYVDDATAPLLKRIAELEARDASASLDERIAHAVRAQLAQAALPAGKDGRDGIDGKDGRDGVDGEKGEPGRDGRDAEPVSDEAIAAAVAKWLEANPPAAGKDGRDGVDGQHGKDGRDGVDGQKGEAGKDGVGLAGALIDRSGGLVLTLTDGTTRELGQVVGRDGKDGAPGRDGERGADGFGLDDFDVEQVDLRTLVLSFTRGEIKQSYEVALGGFIDRGTYEADKSYELGDCVTWGGQMWIAQGPTQERPGGNDAWRLAVRKGRDGKDGAPGKDGERGLQGVPGRDGKPWA